MGTTASHPPLPAELVGLLHAAKQQPEEDAPRLVLADWLEEHGDTAAIARAAFIRLQVQMHRLDSNGPQRRPLAQKANRLFRKHRRAWLGPQLEMLADSIRFERGLLHLEGEVKRFTGAAGAALARAEQIPWLEKLTVRGASEEAVAHLTGSPILPQATSLVIPNSELGVRAARALAHSSAVRGLIGLDLDYNHLGNRGAEILADSPHLAGLRHLDLWLNAIGPAGSAALARSPHLHRLRYLNLGGNSLRARGAEALAASPILASVEELYLWGNDLGNHGAKALAASPHLSSLRKLYLNENRLGKGSVEALAGWTQVGNLHLLSLWGNHLGPAGARVLARVPFRELTTLLLNDNRLGDEGVAALAASPFLGRLTRLNLHGNRISDAGARFLLESPCLGKLTDLNVSDNPISDALRAALQKRYPGPAPD